MASLVLGEYATAMLIKISGSRLTTYKSDSFLFKELKHYGDSLSYWWGSHWFGKAPYPVKFLSGIRWLKDGDVFTASFGEVIQQHLIGEASLKLSGLLYCCCQPLWERELEASCPYKNGPSLRQFALQPQWLPSRSKDSFNRSRRIVCSILAMFKRCIRRLN